MGMLWTSSAERRAALLLGASALWVGIVAGLAVAFVIRGSL